ncbi:MAG: hypothetical protein WDN47_01630 [Candidatus Doudnabacteria bacterium]
MIREVDNTRFLTEDDKLRIKFSRNRGKIVKFVVQYYARIDSKWKTIMRIDNCHGLGHVHKYHLHDREYWVPLGIDDNNKAFIQAKLLIERDFLKIKENYLISK